MRAVTITGTGGIDDVEVGEVPEPDVSADEVRVRVCASGINYAELWIAKGLEGTPPVIPGVDIAGVVDEVGAAVEGVTDGDRVVAYWNLPCGECESCLAGETTLCPEYGGIGVQEDGGHAEYASVPAENLLALPGQVSFESAAAFSSNFGTAWRGLLTRADVGVGDDVLVVGASGGVGHGAVQVAGLAGARVYACTSTEAKAEQLRDLGTDHVIDYTEEPLDEAIAAKTDKRGVDVVFESVGGGIYERAIRSLTQDGRLITIGATDGDAESAMLPYVFWKQLRIIGSTGCTKPELQAAHRQLARGTLRPIVDDTVSFEEVPNVYRRLDDRSKDVFGKVVLTP
jgi:NADPH:quinone reductase-like Zn-dependent oxidoreductase